MRAAQQTTKIIHLCLKTVKSGSNKGSLPIDPIHGERQCQLPPLEGSVAQARSRSQWALASCLFRLGHVVCTAKVAFISLQTRP